MALERGLDAAIMNPFSAEMQKVYHSYKALAGLDPNCEGYIRAAESFAAATAPAQAVTTSPLTAASELQQAIVRGLKDKAGEMAASLLQTIPPLEIVNGDIIPALNLVGEGFEKKTVYLPQLLMSAEAAKSAFESIKAFMAQTETAAASAGPIIIATVKGDIHDIGKNIVKLLLENYGFEVIDLGRDVPPDTVVQAVIDRRAPLCRLSALMTTTVPAMEETVKLLRQKAPWCKVVVGGAALTQEYADSIGADKYAKDAMDTVRYVQEIQEAL